MPRAVDGILCNMTMLSTSVILYPRPDSQLVERALRLHPLNIHTRIRSLQMVDDPVQVSLPFRASLKDKSTVLWEGG